MNDTLDTDLSEFLVPDDEEWEVHMTAPPPGPADPYVGTTIDGRYNVESVIGEGGMGVVYRGRHKMIGKRVAIKVLRSTGPRSNEIGQRFLQEAQAASSIHNPHIIDISDFGTLPDGSPYFVMEYLSGKSLANVIEESRPMPLGRILSIARQVADGLGAAHEAGIVHRDLKPENVIIGIQKSRTASGSGRDVVKIVDFGIAKVANTNSRITMEGSVFGSPRYMSPEQAGGMPTDHRTDIYALGVLIYEMVTGEVPFEAENLMAILAMQIHKAPVPLLARIPPADVPPALDAIVQKCLSKSADARYQSMKDVIVDLEAVEAGRAVALPALTTPDPRASFTNEVGSAAPVRAIGRYALYDPIAVGGMATVYIGRLLGPVGFSRTVAIKRLHPQFSADPSFVAMFLDEARLVARIRHPNVVQTLDVVNTDGELFLVMDYVHGVSLDRLSYVREPIPLPVVIAIISGALQGVHAAHEATDERGQPLSIVHRDISPQNILVGSDGGTRVLDFGIAKAAGRLHSTGEGQIKGKLAYMAPEQLMNQAVGHRLDVYAAGVVLWEMIAGQMLFEADSPGAVVEMVLYRPIGPAGASRATGADEATKTKLRAIDAIIARAVSRKPEQRFPTALAMALELEAVVTPASSAQVGEWVKKAAGDELAKQSAIVTAIERQSLGDGMGPNGVPSSVPRSGSRAPASPRAADIPTAVVVRAGSDAPRPPSQVTTGSMELPRSPTPKWLLVALAGAAVLVGVAIFGLGADHSATAPTAPTTPPASAEPSIPPPPPDESPSAVVSAERPVPSAPSQQMRTIATPPKPPHPTAVPPTVTGPSNTTPGRPPSGAADCDPPYTYDALGHKHYKPECPL